jgi:hypothetical protein
MRRPRRPHLLAESGHHIVRDRSGGLRCHVPRRESRSTRRHDEWMTPGRLDQSGLDLWLIVGHDAPFDLEAKGM